MSSRSISVVLLAALAALGSACGAGTSPAAVSTYARTHAGLCSAASQVRTGSALDARATFVNRSHGDLHLLAADLAEEDRAVAARLLTEKQAVEAGPWVDADPAQADRLLALARTTRVGIGLLGQTEPPACASP